MEYIEFSFIAFDDSPLFESSESKKIVESTTFLDLPIVYHTYIPLAGFDCRILTKIITNCLRSRKQEFPKRKQVILIIYDNPFIEELQIQTKAFNVASFTADVRNWNPVDQSIIESEDLESVRETRINFITEFTELDTVSTYIDNYLYYLLLHAVQEFEGDCLLVHIPTKGFDPAQLNSLCRIIDSNLLQ